MSFCLGLPLAPSRWQVKICMYNSAASIQTLICFLHLPVKVRQNKDAKLCTENVEALSYVAFTTSATGPVKPNECEGDHQKEVSLKLLCVTAVNK